MINVITNAKQAYDYLTANCYRGGLAAGNREQAFAIYLDAKNGILGVSCVCVGACDKCSPDIKFIVRGALEEGAHSIIISHSHPGGSALPSQADILFTTKLKNALRLFDLNLLDHVLVAEDSFYSFAEEKMYESKDDRQSLGFESPDAPRVRTVTRIK